jgi:phenylacetate-CoA ligase
VSESGRDVVNTRYQALRASALEHVDKVESLNREALACWQLELLNRQLPYCYQHSPFYRAMRAVMGLPSSLRSLDTLAQFPFIGKDELRANYPFGFLAVPPDELIRYGESTGTTGAPTASFITYEDWIRGNVWVERAFHHFFGADDVVFVAIPYELAFASYDIDRALEQVGVTVVAVGALNQVCPFDRMAQMLWTVRPTGLVCTPTRALRLFDLLREQGRDPLEVGLRTLLYVGETCSPAKLAKIAELWQVQLVSAYGSTETNSLALPCPLNKAHLTEDRYYFEVVDPRTGTRLPLGTPGELVLTCLQSRAMPLIRYRTGDFVAIEGEACACGSPRQLLRHLGRVSERVVVDKLSLEQVILSTPHTGLYYAAGVVDGALVIRVELVNSPSPEESCREVERRVKDAFDIGCSVFPVDKRIVMRAMDRMLKPGGIQLGDLAEADSEDTP